MARPLRFVPARRGGARDPLHAAIFDIADCHIKSAAGAWRTPKASLCHLGVGVREELRGALMVGVFGHEHAEERAAVDEDMLHRRVSWLSA
jgi:hypothetical protein